MAKPNIHNTSTCINFWSTTSKSEKRDVIPNTASILNILEPIKLPNAMLFCFFEAAIKEAANSGTLVPIATKLNEIILSLTPKE